MADPMARPEWARIDLVADAVEALEPNTSALELRRRAYLVAHEGLDASADDFVDRLVTGQLRYLEERLRIVKERAIARARWSGRGLDRFAPGLDESLDVVRERIAAAGGITSELDAELGRPRGVDQGARSGDVTDTDEPSRIREILGPADNIIRTEEK